MSKMATMPIYGKNPLKISSGIKWQMTLNLGMQHNYGGSGPIKFVQMMTLG